MYYRNFNETISLAVTFIEYELMKISEKSLYLSTDDLFQSLLKILNSDDSNYKKNQARQELSKILFPEAFSETYFSAVVVVDKNGNNVVVGRNINKISTNFNNHVSDFAEDKVKYDKYLIGANDYLINLRDIKDVSTLDFFSIGTLFTYIDVDLLLAKFLKRINYYSELNICIFMDNKLLTHDPYYEMILENINFDDKEEFAFYKDKDTSLFITFVDGENTGWHFVGFTTFDDIYRMNSRIRLIIILSNVGLILALFFPGHWYVKKVISPLVQLSQEINVFELNDFSLVLNTPKSSNATEEVISLYQDISIALKKIQYQVHENYIKKMELQDAQLQMLQSQINPHFLYNTLDSISWMAKNKNELQISRMVLALGKLLRHSLSNRSSTITLGEELTFLDEYLFIQKIRFQDRLVYSLQIDTGLEDIPVLPFIIQPLIENSIKYGIEEGIGNIRIVLSINLENKGFLTIRVEDDGPGYSEKTIIDINNTQFNENERSGIGMKNISRRLSLFYKDPVSLHIANALERGAITEITIPILKG